MDHQQHEGQLLRVSEVARLLNVKEGTVRDWVLLRKIPCLKLLNKTIRIKREVVEKLLAESEIPAARR
jgi:excisionase family DNA binding protein